LYLLRKRKKRDLAMYMVNHSRLDFTPGALLSATVLVMLSALTVQASTIQQLPDSIVATLDRMPEQLPVIDSSFSLDDYVALAAERSPALRAAFQNWKAAVEKSGYAGALPDPILSYGYFIENVETRVGPQNQRIGLRQSFPWFGTLGAKKDIASEQANAALERFEAERLSLFYRVKAAYYDFYFLARDIEITRANLELVTFWESVARTKYKTALRQHPDVIRAQVELGKLEDRLLTLLDQVEPATARLKAAINMPTATVLPLPSIIEVPELTIDESMIKGLVRNYNPDLQAIRHLIAKEEASERLAKKASLPNFTLGLDYIETGSAINPSTPESGKDPWIIGVSINLPIWFGKNNAKKREAVAHRKQAEYRLAEVENQLLAFTERILFEHSDALRKVRLYRDGLVPKAEQSLNTNYTAYQAGELDFLNVLDAQRQLLEFQRLYERALSDLGIRQAELEMITGNQITELVKQ
jgi:outer membrane protein TolC